MHDPLPVRCRLLLMSVGSLVGTALLECIEAIGRDRFELMGMNSEAGAVNNFRIDTCYLSPPAVRHDALFALLDRIVATHAPHLVVPGRDDDVVALAHWAHDRKYAHALAGAPAIADVLRDKWTSFRWAQARGLPFARSAIDLDACRRLVADEGFPVIAKPRKGFASNGVRLVWNDDQLRVALAAGDPVVQQAIDPAPALAAEAIAGGMPLWYAPVQAGSPLGLCVLDEAGCRFVASWRSSHVRGAAFDTSLMQDPQLEALSLRYGQAAWEDGWRGLLSLQVRRNAGGAWIPIELAGRFMGGTNALHRLGIPVLPIVLARFVRGFAFDDACAPCLEARAVKQVTTHLVHARDESTLRASGVWQRPAIDRE